MYELDDAPLTPEQIQTIREVSSATNISDERFTEKLFDLKIETLNAECKLYELEMPKSLDKCVIPSNIKYI